MSNFVSLDDAGQDSFQNELENLVLNLQPSDIFTFVVFGKNRKILLKGERFFGVHLVYLNQEGATQLSIENQRKPVLFLGGLAIGLLNPSEIAGQLVPPSHMLFPPPMATATPPLIADFATRAESYGLFTE